MHNIHHRFVFARSMNVDDADNVAELMNEHGAEMTSTQIARSLQTPDKFGSVLVFNTTKQQSSLIGLAMVTLKDPVADFDRLVLPTANDQVVQVCNRILIDHIWAFVSRRHFTAMTATAKAGSFGQDMFSHYGFLTCGEEDSKQHGRLVHLYWEPTDSHKGACVIERILSGDNHVIAE